MVRLNHEYSLKIVTIAENGYGIAYLHQDVIYVKGALPKEEGKVRIVKKLKDGYVGEMISWHKRDSNRVNSPCEIYDACGSCHLLHSSYKGQLELKREMVEGWVKKSGLRLRLHDVIGMKRPYAYRNKVIIGFQKDSRHSIQAGFYEEFSHRIVPFHHCLLHDEGMDAIIESIVRLMEKYRIAPYEEDKRSGVLRHVVLRKGTVSKQLMVVLVTNGDNFPARKSFVSALCERHPEITTIVQNINTRKTSIVLAQQERVLYGKGFIEDTLCGNDYRISASSFYQINHDQCELLYGKAEELLRLQGNEVLLDAYCGIGTIGMSLAHQCKRVVGVESNAKAVRDAIDNAKRNHVKNIHFVCQDASAFMTQAAKQKERFDAVILDPPRSGSTVEFIRACAGLSPKKIVYISCNPKTQIRDLLLFKKLGYVGSDMFLVDMFPHTVHVESVVMLTKVHN